MNPEQTPPPQPGMPGHDPYDFILNPEKPAKKPIVGIPKGNSLLQRIALVGGGLVILIIIGVIGMSILSSSGKEKTANLLAVAQAQTELIRVANDGDKNATGLPAQNLAESVRASVITDNAQLVAYMKKNGLVASKAQLALKRDKTTDSTLANALASSNYDSAFTTIVQSELTNYMQALQKAYKDNPGPKGKELLNEQYSSAELLQKAAKQ